MRAGGRSRPELELPACETGSDPPYAGSNWASPSPSSTGTVSAYRYMKRGPEERLAGYCPQGTRSLRLATAQAISLGSTLGQVRWPTTKFPWRPWTGGEP
jgi:hypothetical protein